MCVICDRFSSLPSPQASYQTRRHDIDNPDKERHCHFTNTADWIQYDPFSIRLWYKVYESERKSGKKVLEAISGMIYTKREVRR
jgi:hypothetical protein